MDGDSSNRPERNDKSGPMGPILMGLFRTAQVIFWIMSIAIDLQKLGVLPHA